jgi:hypothetical protein
MTPTFTSSTPLLNVCVCAARPATVTTAPASPTTHARPKTGVTVPPWFGLRERQQDNNRIPRVQQIYQSLNNR